ncbi:hypothetical protein B0H19DRAFT_1088747, partial [Mycena capillaripes]
QNGTLSKKYGPIYSDGLIAQNMTIYSQIFYQRFFRHSFGKVKTGYLQEQSHSVNVSFSARSTRIARRKFRISDSMAAMRA